jgi:preprotein translocase subunit SecF
MSRSDVVAPTGLGRLYRGQTAIDFYGRRKVGLVVAVVVLVVTVVSLFTRGLNLGLDFEGGEAWDVPASETFGVAQAEEVLTANDISTTGAKIQRRTSESNDLVTVQVEELPPETSAQLTVEFADAAGVETSEVNFAFTSASWGSEITEKAVRALLIFLAVVAVFISIRFEWRMAVGALAAMVHDVVIVVGTYSVFGFEVTPATVIAFLTILGYSLYDTIVVFDRIKENEGRYAAVRMPYEDIVNISMNQVLMRSINTSISSIMPVVSLLFIGAGVLGAVTLSEFALALLVGMLAGVYSSIFVASPLLARLKAKVGRRSRRPRLTGDDLRAAVMGAGVTGRVRAAGVGAVPDEEPTDEDGAPATGGEGDDGRRDEAVTVPGTSGDAGPAAADRLLTHPPRPRKKKKR